VAVAQDRVDILEDASPVGLIHMVAHPDHLWVETIALDPGHQGRGLGRHLMGHAEAVARSLGLPELRLLTNAAMTSNLRLYTALGFVEADQRPAFRGGFVVYYSKRLVV
jgi:ribosomal protein S18 acetylase RimI-like enzyme